MGQVSFVLLNNIDQFPQDGELKLELNAVHKSFDGLLVDVQVLVLDGEEGNLRKSASDHEEEDHTYVENDDDHIDRKQLPHHPSNTLLRNNLEQLGRLPQIQPADDKFLYAESGHLNVFDVEVAASVGRVTGVPSPVDNGGDAVEETGVNDDHPLDGAQDARVGQDESKSTVQNEGLSGHHDHPSRGVEHFTNP
jgi:hypothetical protein